MPDDRRLPPCSLARRTPTRESWSCYVLLASLGVCHFHKERCLVQGTKLSNLVPSDAIQGICHCWYFLMRLRTYFGFFCFSPFFKVVQACLSLEQKCIHRLRNGENAAEMSTSASLNHLVLKVARLQGACCNGATVLTVVIHGWSGFVCFPRDTTMA